MGLLNKLAPSDFGGDPLKLGLSDPKGFGLGDPNAPKQNIFQGQIDSLNQLGQLTAANSSLSKQFMGSPITEIKIKAGPGGGPPVLQMTGDAKSFLQYKEDAEKYREHLGVLLQNATQERQKAEALEASAKSNPFLHALGRFSSNLAQMEGMNPIVQALGRTATELNPTQAQLSALAANAREQERQITAQGFELNQRAFERQQMYDAKMEGITAKAEKELWDQLAQYEKMRGQGAVMPDEEVKAVEDAYVAQYGEEFRPVLHARLFGLQQRAKQTAAKFELDQRKVSDAKILKMADIGARLSVSAEANATKKFISGQRIWADLAKADQATRVKIFLGVGNLESKNQELQFQREKQAQNFGLSREKLAQSEAAARTDFMARDADEYGTALNAARAKGSVPGLDKTAPIGFSYNTMADYTEARKQTEMLTTLGRLEQSGDPEARRVVADIIEYMQTAEAQKIPVDLAEAFQHARELASSRPAMPRHEGQARMPIPSPKPTKDAVAQEIPKYLARPGTEGGVLPVEEGGGEIERTATRTTSPYFSRRSDKPSAPVSPIVGQVANALRTSDNGKPMTPDAANNFMQAMLADEHPPEIQQQLKAELDKFLKETKQADQYTSGEALGDAMKDWWSETVQREKEAYGKQTQFIDKIAAPLADNVVALFDADTWKGMAEGVAALPDLKRMLDREYPVLTGVGSAAAEGFGLGTGGAATTAAAVGVTGSSYAAAASKMLFDLAVTSPDDFREITGINPDSFTTEDKSKLSYKLFADYLTGVGAAKVLGWAGKGAKFLAKNPQKLNMLRFFKGEAGLESPFNFWGGEMPTSALDLSVDTKATRLFKTISAADKKIEMYRGKDVKLLNEWIGVKQRAERQLRAMMKRGPVQLDTTGGRPMPTIEPIPKIVYESEPWPVVEPPAYVPKKVRLSRDEPWPKVKPPAYVPKKVRPSRDEPWPKVKPPAYTPKKVRLSRDEPWPKVEPPAYVPPTISPSADASWPPYGPFAPYGPTVTASRFELSGTGNRLQDQILGSTERIAMTAGDRKLSRAEAASRASERSVRMAERRAIIEAAQAKRRALNARVADDLAKARAIVDDLAKAREAAAQAVRQKRSALNARVAQDLAKARADAVRVANELKEAIRRNRSIDQLERLRAEGEQLAKRLEKLKNNV